MNRAHCRCRPDRPLRLWPAAPAFAETNVGVSVGISQPGVYGRIDIGNFPAAGGDSSQPVIITPAPVAVHQRPVYLYVPPGHQKNWAKHCGRYGACGQPVYFVQESWVRARYEEHHAHKGGKVTARARSTRASTVTDGARSRGWGAHSIVPDPTWLTRFAARLLRLKPELSALEAVRIGEQQYEQVPHLDPAKAAEIYARGLAANE